MKTSENKLLIFISIVIVIGLLITAVEKLAIREPYPDNSLWQEMFESQRKIDSLRHVLDYYITLHPDTMKVPPIYELYRRINVPPIDSNDIFRYQH